MNRIASFFPALLLVASSALAQPAPPAPPAPPSPNAHRASRLLPPPPGSSFLGVGVAEIDADRAKALNLKEEYGVEVKSVAEDSPAAKAGIKVSDVVLEYNGQRVEGAEQFIRYVRETPVGRQVKLLIFRNGSTQTLTVPIGSRPTSGMFWDPSQFRMPEIRMPDMPRPTMSWQSRTLGVESETLGPQLAEYFGVKEGVLVRAVIKGSAAEKAGLKAGDVITKIGDQKVNTPQEISSALRALPASKAFPVTVVRERKDMKITVTIDEKSSDRNRGELFRMEL